MIGWLRRRWTGARAPSRAIPEGLWQDVLAAYPFLARLDEPRRRRLRCLSAAFLDAKEFHGAQGLQVTDAMALAVAAQACLPLVDLASDTRPERVLAWYDDFVGIVMQPAAVRAARTRQDEDGVVHEYEEELSGEAMDGGPVMLSWDAVAEAGNSAGDGFNVVIHEFAHKIDLKDGEVDGCPPLPDGFMGHARAARARTAWRDVFDAALRDFAARVEAADRFPGLVEAPWLDPYAAHSSGEFFAVVVEAYWVNPERLALEFPGLMPWLDAFFRPRPRDVLRP